VDTAAAGIVAVDTAAAGIVAAVLVQVVHIIAVPELLETGCRSFRKLQHLCRIGFHSLCIAS